MKKATFVISIAVMLSTAIQAQTKLDVVVRPRLEYRDGFSQPSSTNDIGATFIQQRTRLALTTKIKKVEIKLVPQDVRVWGQVPSLNANDGLNSLHEGWMKFQLDSAGKWSVKLGRQELVYDDSRILGNVDWAQQGRSHDAGLISFKNEKIKLDVVMGYNQNGVGRTGNLYDLQNQTKGLQMIHLSTKFKNIKSSYLIMNNVFQDSDGTLKIYALQTIGTFNKYISQNSKFSGDLAIYGQFGQLSSGAQSSSFLAALHFGYKVKKIKLELGGEIISGTDMNGSSTKSNSFNPIFGTNHKFNGLMDYYYVGNHSNSVGLIDLSFRVIAPLSKKLKLIGMIHQFNGAAKITKNNEEYSSDLGQEVDVVIKYNLNDNIKLVMGYSQYFSTSSLSVVKGLTNVSSLNQWGWLMITGNVSKIFKENRN